ncbi:DEAD/DEAH box helicase family protein [Helicobacter sp. MIT 14-3879]|uniref:DEAD/DEAH box helicase family protein n=1 Tax=Helicobacter sp. MIT 14-3879 TaxID=2040649 RepID=UPI0015F19F28|nr:DEAD/DEAH box helicase family protein [Helicobacter sp. MIT 14-3879]
MNKTLSDELAVALKYNDMEIPSYIKDNLSKELREYQITALKQYLLQRQKPNVNHLMFNMATGSGKTLIMAALMLDCYKRGYRDFIFFVNSLSILEKTKVNFCDSKSLKYLFKEQIMLDSTLVKINVINNFFDSRKDCINIMFSSIQGLFNTLKEERENAISLEDFENREVVFLADEAHHLNANTKNNNERELKENWEIIINKAFLKNPKNLMLEFSATIPKYDSVLEKYSDKIIFKYDLKEFHNDGFSKRIFLLKYNGLEKEERFLGSVILNLYRQLLAKEHNIFLKPVILFKSIKISESKENEEEFLRFIERLDSNLIEEFLESYAKLSKNEDDIEALFYNAREFFRAKNISSSMICENIKSLFNKFSILNVNNNEDLQKQQILLNSLESKDNPIRAIFAVDKLNEGWDVLNLFDIVRLNIGAIKESTKEAQLIGRGARYFPFILDNFGGKEREYKRKFDCDITPLRALETLSYHAASENEFINKLSSELIELGLQPPKKKVIMRLKKGIKESSFYKKAYFATNSLYKISSNNLLFKESTIKNIISKTNYLQIPLMEVKGVIEDDLMKQDLHSSRDYYKDFSFDSIPINIILKAMNTPNSIYSFKTLAKKFDIKSREEFIKKYLFKLNIKLHSRQIINNPKIKLKIAKFVLDNFKDNFCRELDSYEVGSWELKPLSLIDDKEIFGEKLDSGICNISYEWFIFDKFVGNKLEKDFLDFIESNKDRISESFSKWLIIRNERFSELVLYDDRKFLDNGSQNINYAARFEPDFYFIGNRNNEDSIICQCIIEAKGEHIELNDKWKEEFLENLLTRKPIVSKDYRMNVILNGMPFYKKDNKNFIDRFNIFLNNNFYKN